MKKLIDFDGNEYKTIKIGKQVWTVENFRCTHYNDGEEIPLVKDNKKWSNLETPGYCFYNNIPYEDSISINKYGALYNWYAVNTEKLAPKGWHVPTDAEWTKLKKNFLKDKFNALPGGYRGNYGTFYGLSSHGYWWSATEYGASDAYHRGLFYDSEHLYRGSYDKRCGFAVRLVRD